MHTPKRILRIVAMGAFVAVAATSLSAQSISTFQGIRFERPQTPKTYITISPPSSAITPYTLELPADPPAAGDLLLVSGTGPFQLSWTGGGNPAIELVSGTGLRRPTAAVELGIVGATGDWTNDLQGSHLLAGGATGDRSTILGGASNSSTEYETSIGGGGGNAVTDRRGVIIGGDGNTVSGQHGVILGGTNNSITANFAVVFGGNSNVQVSVHGFIGAGANNSSSAGSHATIFGGASNTTLGDFTVIVGGYGNVNSGTNSVILGGTNNTASTTRCSIAGGYSNTVGANLGFVGGGASNSSGDVSTPTILGGGSNSTGGSYASIGGGQSNAATSNHSTVGGGQSNSASTGTHTVAFTGQSNGATSNHASVHGGSANVVSGLYAVAMGGLSMTLSAQSTLGMNGGSTAMTIASASSGVLANMDVWLADNDNTPSSMRFFEQYNVAGTIVGANINYVAFKAPTATDNDYSNSYTLPDRVGTALMFISVASSPAPTTTDGTLEWIAIPTYDVVAHAAIASAAFPATTDNADIIWVTSTGAAAARVMTFRNGLTNGLFITVRFSGANAIRLSDGDANLDLRGAADFDMDANDTLTLVWDAASTKWIETGRTVQN